MAEALCPAQRRSMPAMPTAAGAATAMRAALHTVPMPVSPMTGMVPVASPAMSIVPPVTAARAIVKLEHGGRHIGRPGVNRAWTIAIDRRHRVSRATVIIVAIGSTIATVAGVIHGATAERCNHG